LAHKKKYDPRNYTKEQKENESANGKWEMENDEWKMSYVFKGGVPFNNLI